jgi:hypothetical protein
MKGPNAVHLKSMITKGLKMTNKQHSVDQGSSVVFSCNNKPAKILLAAYRPAQAKWLRNGVPVTIEPERMALKANTLKIQTVNVNDNGVYVCQVEHSNGPPTATAFATLIVKSNTPTNVAAGSTYGLDCNGDALAVLFPGLRQMWIHNNIPTSSVEEPISMEKKYLTNIDQSMAGIWQCEVTDPETNRMWVTNRVDVAIGGEASAGQAAPVAPPAGQANPGTFSQTKVSGLPK